MLFKDFGPLLWLMIFLAGCVLVQEPEPAVEQAVAQFPTHLIQRAPLGDSRPLPERQLAYCEHPHENEFVPEHRWRVKVGASVPNTLTIDGFYVEPLHARAQTSPMGCSIYPPGDLGATLWGLEWSPDGRELLYTFGNGSMGINHSDEKS